MKIFQSARYSSEDIYLVAGLGNPTKQYVDTRHNIGFEMVDVLAMAHKTTIKKVKHRALIGEVKIDGKRVIIAKPQTYMNLSGESLAEICRFYKIQPQNVIVIYDEIALDIGKVRIRKNGSDGGHNGVKSIIAQLGTDDFIRVRIGIGAPNIPLVDYVLQKFSKQEIVTLTETAKEIPQIIETIVKLGVDRAMNNFN